MSEALEYHLRKRKEHIQGFRRLNQGSGKSLSNYQRAVVCNFATVVFVSNDNILRVFPGASSGGLGSENHGERKAWEDAQTWYAHSNPKPNITNIIIISDRHPCLDRRPPCFEYFRDSATVTSETNPMPFDLRRDSFIYAAVSPDNSTLLRALLKADLEYYSGVLVEMLSSKQSGYYYRQIEGIANNSEYELKYCAESMRSLFSNPADYDYLYQQLLSMPPEDPDFYQTVYNELRRLNADILIPPVAATEDKKLGEEANFINPNPNTTTTSVTPELTEGQTVATTVSFHTPLLVTSSSPSFTNTVTTSTNTVLSGLQFPLPPTGSQSSALATPSSMPVSNTTTSSATMGTTNASTSNSSRQLNANKPKSPPVLTFTAPTTTGPASSPIIQTLQPAAETQSTSESKSKNAPISDKKPRGRRGKSSAPE